MRGWVIWARTRMRGVTGARECRALRSCVTDLMPPGIACCRDLKGNHDGRDRGAGAAKTHFGERQAYQAPLAAADHLVVPGHEHRRPDHLRALLHFRAAE